LLANAELNSLFKEIGVLQSIASLVQWDNDVMMPKGGAVIRQEQLMFLSSQSHQRLNNPRIPDLIAKAEMEDLDEWQKANLQLIKRQYLHNNAVDKKLVEATTKATLVCELNWREARQNNDFKLFAQHFKEVLKLVQEASVRKSEALNLSPYDSLLDSYDPGRKSEEIDLIFADLEKFLPGFIEKVKNKQSKVNTLEFDTNFPQIKQKALGQFCMDALGFNSNNGRLDISTHPFSVGIGSEDVRITTRYDEDDFLSGLAAIMHEAGHGIYEQNLPAKQAFQLVGKDCGTTIHESQSLFVERHIGITREFLEWLHPNIIKEFGMDPSLTPENLYHRLVKLDTSLIRVDADEVTYPAHVMMRYKLEKAMLSGDLLVDDLPQAWNEESERLFNIRPKNDSEGCLQDVHWAWGALGYFPTYALGAMFAAQINDHVSKLMDVPALIKSGDLRPIMKWQNDNIHACGSRYSASELILKSTGSALDVNIFKNYLTNKYL
jgi:carboxypeptidase Taq